MYLPLKILLSGICIISGARAAERFSIVLPIKCSLGITCFVQNYVDHDGSEKISDYHCGRRTYDGHDGTDFRIPDLEFQRRGVEVLAVAPGRVRRLRDGIDDISVRVTSRSTGTECGNGLIIEHEQGWSTQYCHLAKGSLRVKANDRVSAKQPLGAVGLSGHTEFPHVHLTVRRNGVAVDPFSYDEASANLCGGGRSLWNEELTETIQYRSREIINFGFSDIPVSMQLIESGDLKTRILTADSTALIAYVRAIGLQTGDVQTITILGPDGSIVANHQTPALESDKAQFFVSAGRKRTDQPWAQGTYRASFDVRRDGAEVLSKNFEIQMKQ